MKMEIDFNLYNKFEFEHDVMPLKITGMSIRAGRIPKKHVIIPHSEIKNIVKTLKEGIDGNGAYILKDHSKTVDSAVGRVTKAWKKEDEAHYEGTIIDSELGDKIRGGIISASSAGLRSHEPLCTICGEIYGKCTHILGREYADEGIAEFARDYYEEGEATASIYAKGIEVREQSMVLFPAVAGAGARPTFSFSDDSQSTIDELEKKKAEDLDTLDATETIDELAKLLVNSEGFNKEFRLEIDDSNMADDDNQTIVELSSKLTKLEGEIASKDSKIADLEKEAVVVADVQVKLDASEAQLTQANELLDGYKDAEKTRLETERQELIDELKALRVERGMSETDYSETPVETVEALLAQLKELPTEEGLKGKPGKGKTLEELAAEEKATAMEFWESKIFADAGKVGSDPYRRQTDFSQEKK